VDVGTGAVGTIGNLGSNAMGTVTGAVESATEKIGEVGGNVLGQATDFVQDLQKSEEGETEGAIQQPVYVTSETASVVQPIETQPISSVQSSDPIQPSEPVQSNDTAQPAQAPESVQSSEIVQPSEPVHSNDPSFLPVTEQSATISLDTLPQDTLPKAA
jgi:hypothetical protein